MILNFFRRLPKSMVCVFVALVAIYAGFLYYVAPNGFDFNICFLAFVLGIVVIVCLLCDVSRVQLLSFDLLFSISFVYVNFIYAVFFYEGNNDFSLFSFYFNEKYLTKAACLALMGLSSYTFFRLFFMKAFDIPLQNRKYLYPKWINCIFIVCVIPLIYFNAQNIGVEYTSTSIGKIGGYLRDIVSSIIYYAILIAFYNTRNCKSALCFLPKYFWILLCCLCFVELMAGKRTDVIRYAFVLCFSFSFFVKKIKGTFLFVIIFVGALIMFNIGDGRNGSVGNSIHENVLLNMGNELIINNRSLYVLQDLADKEGFTYGRSFMLNIMSIVPFANSIMMPLCGWQLEDVSSGMKNTMDTFKYQDGFIGLGTNLIGDIYYAFGALGVFALMGFLGFLISKSEANIYKSFVALLVYSMFFANAIYYPRAEYLNLLRIITWTYALYMIANRRIVIKK
jgi:oligosaccharide repeat unit polymerase